MHAAMLHDAPQLEQELPARETLGKRALSSVLQ